MSKGLDAFKRIQCNYVNVLKARENGKLQLVHDLNAIQKELKALKIIKEKRVDVDLFYTIMEDKNQINKLWSYNFWMKEKNKLTQEEFDLLKEVLL